MSNSQTASGWGTTGRSEGTNNTLYKPQTSQAQVYGAIPPGRVGDIAQFIYNYAPYPNSTVSVVGALALMSALCGRFVNVSNTGLNILISVVGGTGIGKEAAASGISRLTGDAAQLTPCVHEFIGPSSLASPEAAHKRLAITPSVLIFLGELGLKLKIWCSPTASPANAGLVAFLLDVHGKSGRGNRLGARENSDKEKGAAAVERPNLVALGDTTETTLLAALNEQTIANGFGPRWIFAFAGDKRGAHNKDRHGPSAELVQFIANLAASSLSYQRSGTVYDIDLTAEAQRLDDEIEAFTSAQVNNSHGEISRHFWSRARLNILKAAAIVAVGDFENTGAWEINAAHILWARGFVFDGIERLIGQVERGELGEEGGNQLKQQQLMRKVIREYLQAEHGKYDSSGCTTLMHNERIFTNKYLSDRLIKLAAYKHDKAGGTAALKRTVEFLLNADEIRRVMPGDMLARYGTAAGAYGCTNWQDFLYRED